MSLTPTNTTEEYLAAIANALQGLPANPPPPAWRHEEFLLAIIQAAGAIQKGVASTYDPDDPDGYGPGDYVAHEGKLYKASSATSGTWDPSAWDEVVLADEVANINGSFDDALGLTVAHGKVCQTYNVS